MSILNLSPDQQDRVWGTIVNDEGHELPFLLVECEEDSDYPCDIPSGLCYITASDGEEIAALTEYNKPEIAGCVWIRLIDEDIRGMADDEVEAWVFGEDFDGEVFALILED